jgi:membrane carboxypeptidase/penicillin-binding protein
MINGSAATFYELKTMLQGVVQRGTASSIRALAPYVAGKTGTSNDSADTWFVGFSNDVTVAVWVGYDNADGQRRSLGARATGNGVATPIFEQIMQGVWAHYAPRTPLPPPTKEIKLQIAALDAQGWSSHAAGWENRPRTRVRMVRTPQDGFFLFENRRQRWRSGGGFFGGFLGWTNRVR